MPRPAGGSGQRVRFWAAVRLEGAKHSGLARSQSKISDDIVRQQADRCWEAPRDRRARDSEGLVRVIGADRDDPPPKIFAYCRIGPRNQHHPTRHPLLLRLMGIVSNTAKCGVATRP